MSISKRFNNSGKTGNHGMQEIDVLKRRMIEDKFDQESTDRVILCGNGCEFTLLGDEISIRESLILGNYINANNLCPFCKINDKGHINFEFCSKNQNKMLEVKFIKDEKAYKTIYKPIGYNYLPPDEIDNQE